MRATAVIAGGMALLNAGALAGQEALDVCRSIGNVEVGYWVEYQLVSVGGAQPAPNRLRQALVGRESVDGRSYLQFETSMSMPQGSAVIQMLVPAYPFEPGDVAGLVMKMGDQPAMPVPREMIQMMRNRMPRDPTTNIGKQCGEAEVVGWESITVPAGTFRALHLRPPPADGATSDIWVSPDIPFGMVRVLMAGGTEGEITLVAHGTDAVSSIN
ncbi:MAG TPA: hypothetical protein VGA37_16970 [Gemmatimonadales bacterium]